MTAEVGVMNRMGVALAADSAVTVGRAAGKIYTSADKLFQLRHDKPVGIMIYGNASLLGVPWETIIKTYRDSVPGASEAMTNSRITPINSASSCPSPRDCFRQLNKIAFFKGFLRAYMKR